MWPYLYFVAGGYIYTEYRNWYCVGNDIEPPYQSASVDECKQHCNNDVYCVGIEINGGVCNKKHTCEMINMLYNEGTDTYLKQCKSCNSYVLDTGY